MVWKPAIAALAAAGVVLYSVAFMQVDLSNRLASWVQAIGSIAAIYGAYAIGRQQRESDKQIAQDLAAEEARNLLQVVKAIADDVFQQILDVRPVFDSPTVPRSTTAVPFLSLGMHYDAPTYRAAVRRLEAVPVFELRRESIAKNVISLQDAASQLAPWLDTARRVAFGPRMAGDESVSDEGLRTHILSFMDDAARYYGGIIDAIGGTPVTQGRPFRGRFETPL